MSEKTYKPLLTDSIKAATEIHKQRFIGFDGNYCTAGTKAYGVSDVEIEKDQMLPVCVMGILLVETGSAITAGSHVASDADGKAVVITDGAESNGYALDNAYSAGEVIRILRGI